MTNFIQALLRLLRQNTLYNDGYFSLSAHTSASPAPLMKIANVSAGYAFELVLPRLLLQNTGSIQAKETMSPAGTFH